MTAQDALARVRAVADAVLYEGYLLYPYRASSSKNRSRWQFGVLGPQGAAAAGVGEESTMAAQGVLRVGGDVEGGPARVGITLRFLHVQVRAVEAAAPPVRVSDTAADRHDARVRYVPVTELTVAGRSWLSWDEAVECEVPLGPVPIEDILAGRELPVEVPGDEDIETLYDADDSVAGRVVRTRWPLRGRVTLAGTLDDRLLRLSVTVENTAAAAPGTDDGALDKNGAIRRSFIGAHLTLTAEGGRFVSLLEPPDDAEHLTATCEQFRCFPVLAGIPDPAVPGEGEVVLVSPIILYDYPEVAEQSEGALFDATEIDEILTLRVMTMTDDEKTQARATDPLAAQIIDRCDRTSPAAMRHLHGILRDPLADPDGSALVPELADGAPWWTPEADASVRPAVDGVLVDGVRVARGSMVRLRPSRRADAQDLFFSGRTARVATVHADVDGEIHVGVVLVDDPAADLHDWYGRYLYFAPDELKPLTPEEVSVDREESQ